MYTHRYLFLHIVLICDASSIADSIPPLIHVLCSSSFPLQRPIHWRRGCFEAPHNLRTFDSNVIWLWNELNVFVSSIVYVYNVNLVWPRTVGLLQTWCFENAVVSNNLLTRTICNFKRIERIWSLMLFCVHSLIGSDVKLWSWRPLRAAFRLRRGETNIMCSTIVLTRNSSNFKVLFYKAEPLLVSGRPFLVIPLLGLAVVSNWNLVTVNSHFNFLVLFTLWNLRIESNRIFSALSYNRIMTKVLVKRLWNSPIPPYWTSLSGPCSNRDDDRRWRRSNLHATGLEIAAKKDGAISRRHLLASRQTDLVLNASADWQPI